MGGLDGSNQGIRSCHGSNPVTRARASTVSSLGACNPSFVLPTVVAVMSTPNRLVWRTTSALLVRPRFSRAAPIFLANTCFSVSLARTGLVSAFVIPAFSRLWPCNNACIERAFMLEYAHADARFHSCPLARDDGRAASAICRGPRLVCPYGQECADQDKESSIRDGPKAGPYLGANILPCRHSFGGFGPLGPFSFVR